MNYFHYIDSRGTEIDYGDHIEYLEEEFSVEIGLDKNGKFKCDVTCASMWI